MVQYRLALTDTSNQPLPTDAGGNPQVAVGQTFRLHGYNMDVRQDADPPFGSKEEGVFAAYMDVFYTNAGLIDIRYGETQSLRFNRVDPSTPISGSFKLTFDGQETPQAIIYDGDTDYLAEKIQLALEGLPNVGPGDVRVTVEPPNTNEPVTSDAVRVQFLKGLGERDVPLITINRGGLSNCQDAVATELFPADSTNPGTFRSSFRGVDPFINGLKAWDKDELELNQPVGGRSFGGVGTFLGLFESPGASAEWEFFYVDLKAVGVGQVDFSGNPANADVDPYEETDTLVYPSDQANPKFVVPPERQGFVQDINNPLQLTILPRNKFTVTSTADTADANPGNGVCADTGGACTLRAAIQETNALANLAGGPDLIEFSIPGPGPYTIQPASALPTIIAPVFIDATTQAGYAGAPVVELDGTNSGAGSNGLWIAAGGSTVRGLAINRFGGSGIQLTTAGGNTIQGNFLGTNLAGTADRGNLNYGLRIAGSHGNTIGGATAPAGNLISGNDLSGILITGGNSNTVLGNFIGTDATGSLDRGNTQFGIVISGASSGTTIGGTASGAGNVISGNNSAGIALSGVGVANTLILGNQIGTDSNGISVVPNVTHGVQITDGSSGNIIGGVAAGAGNVISGNLSGIFLKGGGTNQVQGNRIGTDATGTVDLGNRGNGIQIDSSSTGNTVGGAVMAAGNVISGNNGVGVAISGSGTQNNAVLGNWIGTTLGGSADLGNTAFGVLISGAVNNTIGGTSPGAGNVISGNDNIGVVVGGASAAGNRLEGNRIGTDATGSVDLGNSLHGVQISGGAHNNTIGGTASGGGNLISGNNRLGVLLTGSGTTGNLLQGNRVGTRLDGNAALGNSLHGVQISSSASGNVIGGTASGAGNQISGNVQSGVFISGAANNQVQGNLIGTNAAASGSLGNGLNGLQISSSLATGNTIGGSVVGAGNVISGNTGVGVVISESASGNVISGNLIGSDLTGTADLGNGTFGMLLSTAFNNTIGGTTSGAGNLISGNNSSGIAIQAGSGNTVQGNRIGTDAGGTLALANSLYGVLLLSGTNGNTIGGVAAGAGNTISFNGAGGLRVQNLSLNNAIRGNAIFNNVGVGIDLVGTGGMTANDPGDPDTGPNKLQNFPVINSAVLSGGNLTIKYVVDSATANSAYPLLIDVYKADAAGQEGASYLVTDTYAAANARNPRTVTLAVSGLSANQRIVTTATDAGGNTSEFSASVLVTAGLLAPAVAESGASAATLDMTELTPLAWQAVAAWKSAGLDAARVAILQSLSFEIADLPGRYLGWATPDRIVLDIDAAGYGWYLDKDDGRGTKGEVPRVTGAANSGPRLSTLDPRRSMDLLTVVIHEMGHVLGLTDLDDADEVMAGVLQPGTRHLPTTAEVDCILAGGDWLE